MKFCGLKLNFSEDLHDEMFESLNFTSEDEILRLLERAESESLSSFAYFKPSDFQHHRIMYATQNQK
jgi:hypothetical protein